MSQPRVNARRTARRAAIAFTGAAVLALAACNGGGGGAGGGDDETVQLSYTFWGDAGTRDLHVEVAETFSAQHDSIEIEPIHVPGHTDYIQTIQTRMAGGDPPDVVNFAVYDLQAFGAQGALVPLTERVERDWDSDDLGDNVDVLMDAMLADDEYYGLPRNASGWFLYYNAEMLDEAGAPHPDGTWTWDDLRTYGSQIADSLDDPSSYALAMDPSNMDQFIGYVWSAGGDFFNEDQSDILIDGPEAREAFSFLHGLMNDDGIMTPPSALPTGTGMQDLFLSGSVAMFADTGAHIATLQAADFEWDVAIAPSGPSGESWGRMGATGVTIPQASEHPDEAWEFIRYINSPDGQAILASTGFSGPVRESVLADDSVYLPPEEFEVSRDIVVESYTSHSRIPRGHPQYTEMSTIASDNLELYYLNDIDLDTALSQIRNEIEPLLGN